MSVFDDELLDTLFTNFESYEGLNTFNDGVRLSPSRLVIPTPWSEFERVKGSASPATSVETGNTSHLSTSKNNSSKKRSHNELISPSTSSDSEVSDGMLSKAPRPVEASVSKATVLPRIVKSDLRRKFGLMFMNVMNSMDFTMLDSFFRKFFIPSASLIKTPHDDSVMGCSVHLQSTNLLIAYFGLILQLSPDKILRLGEMKIRQRADASGSELVANFQLRLTKLHDTAPTKMAEYVIRKFTEAKRLFSTDTDFVAEGSKRSNKRAKKFDVNYYPSYVHTKEEIQEDPFYQYLFTQFDPFSAESTSREDFPLLATPTPLAIDGVITFKINDQKRIESLAMVSHFVRE